MQSGVLGIQCSLCPLEDFPATTTTDIEKVLPILDENILAVMLRNLSLNKDDYVKTIFLRFIRN